MVGGGPFGLAPGEWTDDTSMALCLAESLLECGGFDEVDQLDRYVRWWRTGHLSSTGQCFDIGNQTSAALYEFELSRTPQPLPPDPASAGNGSIMRLAPVPIAYHRDLDASIEYAGRSSCTTHPAPTCVDACRYLGALIAGAINGVSKHDLLESGFWRWGRLDPSIDEVARGSFTHRNPPQIKGGGYVVQSLEAALWAFHRTDTFQEGALLAVNLGDDADTTGAVYGQIAGAVYGASTIPARWLEQLVLGDVMVDFADRLATFS
jgi:ADP-ribosylglycohydrolase